MDNVLPAVLVVAVMMMAGLSLGRSGFSSFNTLSEAWQDAEERSVELARSNIVITSISRIGANVDVAIRNAGNTPVVDYSRMDVVVQYRAGTDSYIKYIPFTTLSPQPDNTWRVLSISNDVIDPGVLNTGETLNIRVKLNPQPSGGTSNWLQVTTELGVSASMFFN